MGRRFSFTFAGCQITQKGKGVRIGQFDYVENSVDEIKLTEERAAHKKTFKKEEERVIKKQKELEDKIKKKVQAKGGEKAHEKEEKDDGDGGKTKKRKEDEIKYVPVKRKMIEGVFTPPTKRPAASPSSCVREMVDGLASSRGDCDQSDDLSDLEEEAKDGASSDAQGSDGESDVGEDEKDEESSDMASEASEASEKEEEGEEDEAKSDDEESGEEDPDLDGEAMSEEEEADEAKKEEGDCEDEEEEDEEEEEEEPTKETKALNEAVTSTKLRNSFRAAVCILFAFHNGFSWNCSYVYIHMCFARTSKNMRCDEQA